MVKIAHISDIHWRGIQRHEEYTRAFLLLFNRLREEQPDLIVCTGDIFHTKTQGLTPEVIDKMVWMFNGLAEIAPVHTILGNHDGNLTNEDRQDAISPIVDAINSSRVSLYKKSGVYTTTVSGLPLNFCAFSCFDKDGWSIVKPKNDGVNIALFHGSVLGCMTDSMWRLKEGEVMTSFFDGYDIAMLGDIHKQQFLGLNTRGQQWIGYPGSLIQQNYGEDLTKGFLVWNIVSKDDWTVEFKELTNLAPFLTIQWQGTVKKTVEHVVYKVQNGKPLNHVRIRVKSEELISQLESRQLRYELVQVRGAVEVIFNNELATNKSKTVSANNVNIHKSSLRNDADALCKLYHEYTKTNSKQVFSQEQHDLAEETIKRYVAKLKEQDQDGSVRDVTWSIKNMEFDNLYRYGEGNKIDFEKLSGVVGIFAPNRAGKSSIVGSLMFGLFNTTDRGSVKSSYIINKNKSAASCRILVNVGGVDYYIVRQIAKVAKRNNVFDEEKASTTLNLYRALGDGTLSDVSLNAENGETRPDTDKTIRRLIGTSQDFLLTAFSNQGGINRFIEEGSTERKAILNRFLDLDVFEKLCKFANDDKTAINARTSTISNAQWELTSFALNKNITVNELAVKDVQTKISMLRTQTMQLRSWLKEHENTTVDEHIRQKSLYETELAQLLAQVTKQVARENQLQHDISTMAAELSTLELARSKVDVVELMKKKVALQTLRENFSKLMNQFDKEKTKLESQNKSVRKLNMVPCGDMFPNCHFIKDGHEDKKLIESQKDLVSTSANALESLKAELETLEKEQLDKKLLEHSNGQTSINSCQRNIASAQREMELIKENKLAIEQTLAMKKDALNILSEKLSKFNSVELLRTKADLKRLEQELNQNEETYSSLLIQMGKDKAKVEQLQKEKEECCKLLAQLKIYESIFQGFSKTGIPAMVLKTQLPIINSELEKILSTTVEFRVTIETEVNSNTLDVFIEDGNSRRVIELGSGMEKMIASLALRTALINLSSLPKPDMFIVEESFGSLDENNCSKVISLLQSLRTMFKTILIISHVPEMKEAADIILDISYNDTESKITWPN